MKDPLGVSPSKGNQGTKRGKEKILLPDHRKPFVESFVKRTLKPGVK